MTYASPFHPFLSFKLKYVSGCVEDIDVYLTDAVSSAGIVRLQTAAALNGQRFASQKLSDAYSNRLLQITVSFETWQCYVAYGR